MAAERRTTTFSLSSPPPPPSDSRQATAFRKLLTSISAHLQPDEIATCSFLHNLPKEPSSSALGTLRRLMQAGVFSHTNVAPLEQLLRDIGRHDLVHEQMEAFKQEYPQDADSLAGSLRYAANEEHPGTLPLHPHSLPPQKSQSKISLRSLSTDDKRQLLHSLRSDPDLQSEFQSLPPPLGRMTSVTSSTSTQSPQNSLSHTIPSTITSQSSSEASQTSPDTSLLTALTPRPTFLKQVSDESGFCTITTGGGGERACPLTPPATPPSAKKRMEWSIDRVGLGQRIVQHSNCPFIKGNFSLQANGLTSKKWWLKNPVSLVFNIFPCGLRKDENESLTLEVLVHCCCKDILSVAKVNLEITVSMDGGKEFISTRTWQQPLRKFRIYDFLPHEVVTRSYCKTLDFTIQAFVAYD